MIKQINLFKCLHLPLNTSLDELYILKLDEFCLCQEQKNPGMITKHVDLQPYQELKCLTLGDQFQGHKLLTLTE